MKYLLSLMLVATMTCKQVSNHTWGLGAFYRCENKEVICYLYDRGRGAGISCKFKELDND